MKNIIKEFVKGSGQYTILPEGKRIKNAIEEKLESYLTKEIGFEEVELPKIVPRSTLEKAGILDRWNDYLISVKPYGETKGVKDEYIMDPLQCLACYQAFEDDTIDVSKGPLKWYDCSGPTYRNEELDKIKPGVKQREFHRAEYVYIGTKEQVEETREKCLSQLIKLCTDLGLKNREVTGDSCYQEGGNIKDVEVYIPHENKWLELAGAAVLHEIVTSKFNIKGENGEQLHSGCTGIGLDRFMYALVSNGVDLK
ncbi:aminoacyl--tRNA ligase-related protein [Nanoarchaeota archaeon]